MTRRMLGRVAVAALCISTVYAKPEFVRELPNGGAVPGIAALGHKNTIGGGALNAFGEAFEKAGFKWTTELCRADSDGDGRSNGEELGDPCCVWKNTYGNFPTFSEGISHPGDASKAVIDAILEQYVCGFASGSGDFSGGANPDPSESTFNESTATSAVEDDDPVLTPSSSPPTAAPSSGSRAVHNVRLPFVTHFLIVAVVFTLIVKH